MPGGTPNKTFRSDRLCSRHWLQRGCRSYSTGLTAGDLLRILIAEDEYLVASILAQAFSDAGVEVVGPASTITQVQTLIAGGPRLDAAVLDVNLRGTMVYPVASTLLARNVPFVFATGYRQQILPSDFCNVPYYDKPYYPSALADTVIRLAMSAAPTKN